VRVPSSFAALASLGLPERVLALALLGFAFALPARAEIPVPPLRARVTDQAGLLPPERVAALEAKLAEHERATGNQIAVLTIDTTDGEPIESFALRVAEAWKLGRKGIDDGAVVVVAKSDRAARIEVGYGLEGAIPDAIAKRILEDVMLPRFREGDFAGGLDAATDALTRAARGEALPPPTRPTARNRQIGDPIGFVLFLSVLSTMVSAPFRRRARPVGALLGGAVAGGIAWFVLHLAFWSAVAFAIGTLLGWIGPTSGVGGGRTRGWGGGGFGGGWSGGGGGGGWSGGGGGFGGGGASGRW
jgi:uncharacterized protein